MTNATAPMCSGQQNGRPVHSYDTHMKKSASLLFAITALFATACNSQATIDQPTAAETTDAGSVLESEDLNAEVDTAKPTGVPEVDGNPVPAPTVGTTSEVALLEFDDWCSAAAQIKSAADNEDSIAILKEPAELEDRYRADAALMNAAVPVAPAEIANDVAQIAEAWLFLNELLAEANWDFNGIDIAVLEEFDDSVAGASYNIERYNYDVCGLGADPGAAPVPGAATE